MCSADDGGIRRSLMLLSHAERQALSLRASVVRGNQRGCELGFPTANLSPDAFGSSGGNRPPNGVYIGFAKISSRPHSVFRAYISIGDNPSFGDNAISIEANLDGEFSEFYGDDIRLLVIARLRDMAKLSYEHLKAAIANDVKFGREALLTKELKAFETDPFFN